MHVKGCNKNHILITFFHHFPAEYVCREMMKHQKADGG